MKNRRFLAKITWKRPYSVFGQVDRIFGRIISAETDRIFGIRSYTNNFHHHILLLWLRPNFRRTHDDAMQMMKQAIKGLVWPLGIFSCQSTCILACPKVAQYGWHVWPDRNGKVFVRSIAAWNPPTIRISIYRCPARFGPTKSSGYIYVAHCTYTLTHTHRCNAQSSFLPSTEHLRNEPTALKSPAYFKPVFRAFPTDRSGSFWCQRSLMTAFQRLDKF